MRGAILAIGLIAIAGCAEPAADTLAAPGLEESQPVFEEVTVEVPVHTPVDWRGNTVAGLWLCDLPGCPVGHFQQSDDYEFSAGYEGSLHGVRLHLNWTQADPAVNGLVLAIVTSSGQQLGTWSGTSSFLIEASLNDESGEPLTLRVWPAAKDGNNVFIDPTEQDFTLEGAVTGIVTETRLVQVEA